LAQVQVLCSDIEVLYPFIRMFSSTGGSMMVAASLPNEWRSQAQGSPSDVDELWQVEWGSVAAFWEEKAKANAKNKWQSTQGQDRSHSQMSNCQPMLPQTHDGIYYVPMLVHTSQLPQDYAAPNVNIRPAESVTQICPPTSVDRVNEEIAACDGELPSIGSVGHADGSCKRCAFFPKGRCQNGKDCTHCHFQHQPRSRLRKRAPKGSCADEPFPPQGDVSNYEIEVVNEIEVVRASMDLEVCPIEHAVETEAAAKTLHDDETESETTEPSASALSEVEDGPDFGFTDSEKTSKVDETSSSRKESASESSDSETAKDTSRKGNGLTPSPSSWSARERVRKASSVDGCNEVPAVEIGRMARGLLNKLTEERFESLASQMLALPLSTTEQLAVVVAELFEKATTQDGFRSLYTELCTRLDTHLAAQSGAIGGKAFRKALVNECQAAFERNLQPAKASLLSELVGDELFEMEMKLKTCRLGNMRFIGDLFVRRLLSPKLMPPIVHELMNGDEAALENLVALLTVIAPSFEQKTSVLQAVLKEAFAKLRRQSTDTAVSSCVRCRISDLLEARARGWTSRSAQVA